MTSAEVGEQLACQPARIAERQEVTAGQLVELGAEPFARDPPLEFQRKEAVVAAGDDVGWQLGPGLESAGFAEDGLGFFALLLLAARRDLGWNVMQEVSGDVELRAVAAVFGGRDARPLRAGGAPPGAGGLAGLRDHGVD